MLVDRATTEWANAERNRKRQCHIDRISGIRLRRHHFEHDNQLHTVGQDYETKYALARFEIVHLRTSPNKQIMNAPSPKFLIEIKYVQNLP